MTIPRRSFIALAAGAAFAPFSSWGADIPTSLDHFILGCADLDLGIDFVAQHTGVRAAFGGVHPGRGTRNALLSLGERRYLEIMAPDPAQTVTPQIPQLRDLKQPRIVGWAAHIDDMKKLVERLRNANLQSEGPRPGSRQRPDDKVLHWASLSLKNDHGGLLPFFIEWSADSLHPSADSPKGCSLTRFGAVTPNPDDLTKITDLLQLSIPISRADNSALQATIVGPKGDLAVTS